MCACENLYAYMYESVKGLTHARFVIHLLKALCVFRLSVSEKLHKKFVSAFEIKLFMCLCSQEVCTPN